MADAPGNTQTLLDNMLGKCAPTPLTAKECGSSWAVSRAGGLKLQGQGAKADVLSSGALGPLDASFLFEIAAGFPSSFRLLLMA